MFSTEYLVTGMTCANCERHIRSEVEAVAGVQSIDVSSETGRLRVTSEHSAVNDEAVIAAVAEAGYEAVKTA
jgi:copper chaperone